MGTKDVQNYINKAKEFSHNLKVAKKSKVGDVVEGDVRYKKIGKYIEIAPDGKIISFGKINRIKK